MLSVLLAFAAQAFLAGPQPPVMTHWRCPDETRLLSSRMGEAWEGHAPFVQVAHSSRMYVLGMQGQAVKTIDLDPQAAQTFSNAALLQFDADPLFEMIGFTGVEAIGFDDDGSVRWRRDLVEDPKAYKHAGVCGHRPARRA